VEFHKTLKFIHNRIHRHLVAVKCSLSVHLRQLFVLGLPALSSGSIDWTIHVRKMTACFSWLLSTMSYLVFVLFTKTLSIIHHVAVINTQRIRNTVISTCCHFTSDDVLTTIMTPCVVSRLQQYMWQFNSITSSHLGGGEMICLCRWQLDLRRIYVCPWMGLQYSASTRG